MPMPKGFKTGKPAWNRGKPGYWTGKKRPELSAEKNPAWSGGADRYCKRRANERDDYTCQRCGLCEPEIMEADHVIPKSERPDLQYALENLITLCPNCHRRKTIREHKARTPWNKRKAVSKG
jgi:5-methylcytosine-specific restriction endonuclease McrA